MKMNILKKIRPSILLLTASVALIHGVTATASERQFPLEGIGYKIITNSKDHEDKWLLSTDGD